MSEEKSLYRRTVSGFVPINDLANEFALACKVGDIIELVGHRPRNPIFHKLWWAMLRSMAEHSYPPMGATQLNFMAKVATGTGEWVKNPRTGIPLFMPASISFAAMDEIAFRIFVRRAAEALCDRFLPGVVADHFIDEMRELAIG